MINTSNIQVDSDQPRLITKWKRGLNTDVIRLVWVQYSMWPHEGRRGRHSRTVVKSIYVRRTQTFMKTALTMIEQHSSQGENWCDSIIIHTMRLFWCFHLVWKKVKQRERDGGVNEGDSYGVPWWLIHAHHLIWCSSSVVHSGTGRSQRSGDGVNLNRHRLQQGPLIWQAVSARLRRRHWQLRFCLFLHLHWELLFVAGFQR